MGALCGKNGKLRLGASDFAHVRNITFEMTANNKTYSSSTTDGHQRVCAGQKSGTLTFDVVIDPSDYLFDRIKIGDTATLLMYENDNRNWSIPCVIDSISEEIQIEEGEPATSSVSASTHGAWTYPDGTVSS